MSSFTSTDTDPNISALPTSSSLFERHETVGSGGIGTVYRGTQSRLGRGVAIKEIKDIFHVFADVQRDDIVGRFLEIVQTQSRLNHTNIIETFDVITDEAYPYVITQWAPLGNLRRLIQSDGRPSLRVAMRYFLQILHALNAAHDSGVVHGGIKPENVVLDQAGNALLTDFGLSRVVERSSGNQVYVGVGTVAYMSPEQFQDPGNISVKSDIYSLGIMFYEMLTGKVPGRRSPMPSSFYPDIPRKLDDIFDRMCMDAEEDRYDDIDDIISDVYESADVMKILDKRAGVLFLRDPMKHGDLDVDAVDAPSEPIEEFSDPVLPVYSELQGSLEAPSSSLEETTSEPVGDGGGDGGSLAEASSSAAEDAPVEEAHTSEASDNETTEENAAGGDDVLGKLDKYGAMFEDDDDLD